MKMKHEFVEYIPDKLEAGMLYVSMTYGTVTHLCPCGCKNEVVTPLTPTDWALTFNGENITLHPSIGNWDFDCRSHYWIRKSKVEWAGQWTDEEIDSGRRRDKKLKEFQFEAEHEAFEENHGEPIKAEGDSRWWLVNFFRNILKKRV